MPLKELYTMLTRKCPPQINYTNRVVEQIYRLHDAGINALVVTDGFCVTGSDDRFLRVWPLDFSDYFLEAQHAAPVMSVGVSSDCLKIAISTQNGTVGVMDVPSHGYRTVVRSHESAVCAMSMDPNNREFTTTATDGTIRTWDLDSYDQLYEFVAREGHAWCVEYHPTKYIMACGFDDGIVRIFDLASTSQLYEYRQHQRCVNALVFSPDGSRLFSGAKDGHFCVYDAVHNYQPIKTVACSHAGDDVALSISPNGKMLAALGVKGASIHVLNAETMDKIMELSCGARTVRLLQFSPILNELFAITSDCRLHRYDLDKGELAHESISLHLDIVHTMDISDNGKLLLTGGNEGLIKVWALGSSGPNEKRCQTFIGHPAAVKCAHFTADKTQVVSAGDGYGILIWDLLANASEDLSDYVDRLIDQRAAEQQRLELEAVLAEESIPQLPKLGVGMGADSLIETLRDKLRDDELDSDAGTASDYETAAHSSFSEPSPLMRVRERAVQLDISMTPVHSHVKVADRSGFIDDDSASNLPLIHYCRRRPSAKRAERKYVAPDDEAGLKMVHMVGVNNDGHDNVVWDPASGLMAISIGCTVVVDNLETSQKRFLQGHDADISCLALSSDGNLLASARGSADASVPAVVVWAIDQDKPLLQLNCHHQGVQSLSWSPDGRHLLSVGNCMDGKIAMLSMETREIVMTADCPHAIHAAQFSATGTELVTVGYKYVTFWRFVADASKVLQAHREEREAPNEERNVHYTCVDLVEDENSFFVGSASGGVSQWVTKASGPTCTGSWQTEQGELSALRCRGKRIITCGQSPHVRIWEHFDDQAGEGYWQVCFASTSDVATGENDALPFSAHALMFCCCALGHMHHKQAFV
jgi:WD40 repeat protein